VKWTNSSLDQLKVTFGKEPFSAKQAVDALKKQAGYSDNTAYQVLHELVKEGTLTKLGRGIYRVLEEKAAVQKETSTFSDRVVVTLTSGILLKAEATLKEKGIEFMITGPSVLMAMHHHLARRLIYLVYVIDGAGEYTVKTIKDLGFQAFLNPKRNEVELALQAFEDRDIFVIREYANLEGNIEGRAILERALVDTYFESTRRRIPFSEMEVGRIIANAFRQEKIDIARLLSLAARRGVKSEFQSLVKVLVPDIRLSDGVMNEKVKQVLKGVVA
jgi:hypothetical protein